MIPTIGLGLLSVRNYASLQVESVMAALTHGTELKTYLPFNRIRKQMAVGI